VLGLGKVVTFFAPKKYANFTSLVFEALNLQRDQELLYTIIMDYKGGAYISQGVGTNPTEGTVAAIRNHNYSDIPGLVPADKSLVVLEIESEGLLLLQELKKVYCGTVWLIDGYL